MNKQLTVEDIMSAKEIYYYNNVTLYIVDSNDEAYGYSKLSPGWYHKANFWDYFDSELLLPYFTVLRKEEAVQLYLDWINKVE